MGIIYAFYNPLVGNHLCGKKIRELERFYTQPIRYCDMTCEETYREVLPAIGAEDQLVLCGGDGTLNRFINRTQAMELPEEIYYYPCGSGNDFARDLGRSPEDGPFEIKRYLCNLPTIRVNGREERFLNGIGYGIDGYCCEAADEIRRENPSKEINYTKIALKGLLYAYKPTNAEVTVDGVTRRFCKVWMCPTMKGRYFGGGIMATPGQDRLDSERRLMLMVLHDIGNLHTLMLFPSVFTGKHVKYKKYVEFMQGKEITVKFDRPTALQIDGETVLGVTEYTAVL